MISHIVEHCIGHSVLDMEDFFEFSYWLDGVINTDYTYFEFDKRINYEDAVKKITKEITKEYFLYEKDIIKQELEDVSYDQRIYEYVVRKYLDSDFFMNKYQNVLRKDVKDYHEKYYIQENMIVVDDEFNVLKQWFKLKYWDKDKNNKVVKKKLKFEGDKYLVYLQKNRLNLILGNVFFLPNYVFLLSIFSKTTKRRVLLFRAIFLWIWR